MWGRPANGRPLGSNDGRDHTHPLRSPTCVWSRPSFGPCRALRGPTRRPSVKLRCSVAPC